MHKKGSLSVLTVLVILLIAALAVSGYKLFCILREYEIERVEYSDLSEEAATIKTYIAEEDDDPVPEVSEVPIELDWELLRQINPEIAGWLYCPATRIHYPVMQTDNNDFYLHRNFRGEYAAGGALFADCGSVFHLTNSILVIYGHNMKDGSMFGTLTRYRDHDYFVDNPYMWLLTPEQDYRVELFACREAEAAGTVFRALFRDEESCRAYVDDVVSRSYWAEEDRIHTEYQLITLSTCSYHPDYTDSRLLLYGFLCPADS